MSIKKFESLQVTQLYLHSFLGVPCMAHTVYVHMLGAMSLLTSHVKITCMTLLWACRVCVQDGRCHGGNEICFLFFLNEMIAIFFSHLLLQSYADTV